MLGPGSEVGPTKQKITLTLFGNLCFITWSTRFADLIARLRCKEGFDAPQTQNLAPFGIFTRTK